MVTKTKSKTGKKSAAAKKSASRIKINALVTGATGQQGGAVARVLLERGHKVRALTRHTDSPASERLGKRGMEVVQGDFDDTASLERAMDDMDAVFAMGTATGSSPEAETRQGRNLVDAARECGIEHFVYSSVASADKNTGIAHFDSKYAVETYLQSADVPFTIVGPVFFMENMHSRWIASGLKDGRLALPLSAKKTLQQVALTDLAEFVALIMERRHTFLGKRIEVASDGLTGTKAAATLTRIIGHKIMYVETPIDELEKSDKNLAAMFRWFDRVGWKVDIQGLHRRYPEVGWHTFDEWAKSQDWHDLQPAARRGGKGRRAA